MMPEGVVAVEEEEFVFEGNNLGGGRGGGG